MTKVERDKIQLSNKLAKQLYSLHKKVLNEIVNNSKLSLSLSQDPSSDIKLEELSPLLLLFKDDYKKTLESSNKKIGLLKDEAFYNSLFSEDSTRLLVKSYQSYLIDNDIKTQSGLLKSQANLIQKSNRDASFFIQSNYERQDLI